MQRETSQLGILSQKFLSKSFGALVTYKVVRWGNDIHNQLTWILLPLRLIKNQNDLNWQILVSLWPGVLSHWRVRFYNISNIDSRELLNVYVVDMDKLLQSFNYSYTLATL